MKVRNRRSLWLGPMSALLLAGLPSCGSAETDYGEGYYAGEDEFGFPRDEFDEDAAREAAEDELASEGYDGSYGCTEDCSGHEAGWQWRADHGFSTGGYSESFEEGGMAFDEALDDRVDDMRDAYENGEDIDY